MHSDWPFLPSRCSFIMLSKPIAKPKWKWKMRPTSAILCTQSRLKIFVSHLFVEIVCGSNTCAKSAREVHVYCVFRRVLDSRPFWDSWTSRDKVCIFCCMGVVAFRVFFKPKSYYRLVFVKVCYMFLNGLGVCFAMFWEASTL